MTSPKQPSALLLTSPITLRRLAPLGGLLLLGFAAACGGGIPEANDEASGGNDAVSSSVGSGNGGAASGGQGGGDTSTTNSTATTSGAGGGDVLPQGVPSEAECGPVTMWARDPKDGPASLELANQQVITKDKYGKPMTHVLAEALRRAEPGDTIAVSGVLKGVNLGDPNSNAGYAVWWPGGAVIQDICIVSEKVDQPAIIDSIAIMGDVSEPGQSGVDELTLKNVKLRGKATPLIVYMNTHQGMIRAYDVEFISGDPSSYGGYGMKWGARFHGRARLDFRRVSFPAAEEHAMYIDSPGWDGQGDSYIIDIVQTAPSGRTGIQIVNRADPKKGGGKSGRGDIYIHGADLWTKGGGGGFGITVAGHLGTVYIEDLTYKGDLGGVVFWSDASKGLHKNENGFTCSGAVLKNIAITSPNADRSHMAFSGVEHVSVHAFSIEGNRIAIDVDNQYGGPVPTGKLELHLPPPVSQYEGFKSAKKVVYKGKELSDEQVDALGVWP